jgi:hypothetical protein
VNAHELVAYLAGLDCCVALVRFDPQLGLVELLVPVLDRHARQAVNALLAGALLSAARLHTLLELMWFGVCNIPNFNKKKKNSRDPKFRTNKNFYLHIVPCIGLVHLSDMP